MFQERIGEMVRRFRKVKERKTLADVHKANRFRQWFYKEYPPFRPPQLTCGKTMVQGLSFISLLCWGNYIGAFRRKPSNRFLKKKAIWLEKYGDYINDYKRGAI